MDIDQLKSATATATPEIQTDFMMSMMMHSMDKLPDFFASFDDVPSNDPMAFSPSGPSAATTTHTFLNTSTLPSPPPTANPPLSIQPPPPPTRRWRGGGEPITATATTTTNANNSCFQTETGIKQNSMAAMREMIFRMAVMQPVHIDPESVKPPKRRNVRISNDPQSVAARHRRERISERIRILQRLVPGGTKMDTASMLDEAIHYVKFLKSQVQSLERASVSSRQPPPSPAETGLGLGFPVAMNNANIAAANYLPMTKAANQHQ